MKRTEKSKANSWQKTKVNSKQSEPKDCDRDKAKYEEKCRCPAGPVGAEACRRDHDPQDRLRRGIVSARNHPDSSGAATQKLQKIVMDSLSLEQMYDGSQFSRQW